MALENNANTSHLVELRGSNYEIADGEPDILGWEVSNIQGQIIGEVDDLLFDPQLRKVRYIIVKLDDELEDKKKVLIPIGVAELHGAGNNGDSADITGGGTNMHTYPGDDEGLKAEGENSYEEDDDLVIVPVTAEQLRALPTYKKDSLTAETEFSVRRIFEGSEGAEADYSKDHFYQHDQFNDDKFYAGAGHRKTEKLPVIEENLSIGKREVETGGARITSRIVERPVEESVNLRQEHVTVERTPVDRPASSSGPDVFQEEELVLTERAEVPVVNKEARVVEEVFISKEVAEREETIRETLRNTEIEAERFDSQKKGEL